MAFFFPDFIRSQLAGNSALFNNFTIGVALFHAAPTFVNGDDRYANVKTLADLNTQLGWTEANVPGYPIDNTRVISTRVVGNSTYVILPDLELDDDLLPVQVRTFVFYYKGTLAGTTNPIIFATNSPVNAVAMLKGGDRIAPIPDVALGAGSNTWLFGWANSSPSTSLVEGGIALQKSAPEFEPAYTQHAWMFPQRVNYIANPNFEGGVTYWRTNGTVSQVTEATNRVARFTGAAPLVVESNKFPARSARWTVQVFAKGTGKLKIGLVSWPADYTETTVDWGYDEEWPLPPEGYGHIYALRQAPQPHECQLRLEVDGGNLTIDKVLVEDDFLLDWPYFDGDTTYGARDDFSWYGGENLKGKTYSIWYNNRRATAGRLFATPIDGSSVETDTDELSAGLVYRWVPAGVLVEPHWDVLFKGDHQHPVSNPTGTAVTPYKKADPGTPERAKDLGVASPWPQADGYLTPTVGTVSTPDPGPLPAECCWVAHLRLADKNASTQTIAVQRNGGQLAFTFRTSADNLYVLPSTNGTANSISTPVGVLTSVTSGVDTWLAGTFQANNGVVSPGDRHVVTGFHSPDGVTFSALSTPRTASPAVAGLFDSSAPVTIGGRPPNLDLLNGRIYSVELRSGLDPAAGSVLWRFDANEYPGITVPNLLNAESADFETGIGSQWTVYGGSATMAQADSPGGVSGKALAITKTGATENQQIMLSATAAGYVAVTAGQTYTARCSAYRTGTGTINFYVYWFNNAGTYVGNSPAYAAPSTASWVSLSSPGLVAPAGATRMSLSLVWATMAPGEVGYVDQARVFAGNVNAYTDPRGRTWTLTNAAAITPEMPA